MIFKICDFKFNLGVSLIYSLIPLIENNLIGEREGASTLCRVAEWNKMQPCCAANGENNVDDNAAWLRQGFFMLQHAMRHENSIGKMLVSSKVCHTAYDE